MKDRGLPETIGEGMAALTPGVWRPVPGGAGGLPLNSSVGSAGQLLQQAWPCVPLSKDTLTIAPGRHSGQIHVFFGADLFPHLHQTSSGVSKCKSVQSAIHRDTSTLNEKGPFLYSWPQFS